MKRSFRFSLRSSAFKGNRGIRRKHPQFRDRKAFLGMEEATFSGLALLSLLGGGTAPLSPFQRSPSPSHGSLPPLIGPQKESCDQGGHTPLDPPNIVSLQRCCSSRESDGVGHRVCLSLRRRRVTQVPRRFKKRWGCLRSRPVNCNLNSFMLYILLPNIFFRLDQ
jgi:hypothetical protein